MKESSYLLFCVLILYLRFSSCDKKCTSKGLIMNRNFYVGEHDLTFRIETSKRISHRLVSNIAKFLLKEALGYEHVIIIEEDTDNTERTLQRISTCKTPSLKNCSDVDETGPQVMINLELWLYPGFNLERWINTHRIEDCGPLGPIGRAGWFIEKRVVDFLWNQNGTIVDHYKAFLNPEVTEKFDLTLDPLVIEKAQKTCNDLKDREKYGCGPDGFYRPPQCNTTSGVRCATILSDYPQSTFASLTDMILSYNLLVNIAWLGDEFENSLLKKIGETKKIPEHILFFHKVPMILSNKNNFTHVKFPDCEDDLLKCEFEVNQLQKVVWSEINASAPLAFHLIRAMTLTPEQYNLLLDSYIKAYRRHSLEQVACDWVSDNQYIWTPWIPVDAESKNTLYLGGIFPEKGIYWKQKSLIEAAKMAADAINKNNSLLRDYEIEILHSDGRCATDEVMKSFIQYVKSDKFKATLGILGPACSDTVEPIAGVAKHFNTIIISYSAEGTLFNNEEKEDKYRFFFRTIPENSIFRYVFIKLFKKLDYTRVAAITEEGQKYPQYLSYLQDLMKSHKMTFIENRKFPRERDTNMTIYLDDLNKKGARIIIGDFYDYAARSVMCTAYKLRMIASNGYIWFLPSWFPADWYDTDKYNNLNNGTENVACTTEEMIEAINGHISFSYKHFADNESIMQEEITVKNWRENYKKMLANVEDKIPSNYAGYTYDAVWVYALAFNALLKENASHVATLHSDKTSKRFVRLLRQTHFNGVSGPLFFQNGSRISDVMIWQWLNQKHNLIGVYKALSLDDGELELNITKIKWLTPNGQKPPDFNKVNEYCGVEDLRALLNVKCETAKIVANVLGLTSFAFIVVMCIIVYKRRYDKRLKNQEKRIKELALLTREHYCLDEWELPRERLVLNRKIGEGAFGTVYGGEAFMPEKGWIAVAVKALKRNSKIQEKLDFLGEAEVMKQFDHVNIIKLIGVCTTEEPIYTVMEFMLYGDLRYYLLSRRHMVTEVDRSKNEEVSNRRLTNMAMDIARGLSYLADLKFVHRDLACRNCLVNSSRSVKIADFGMCRAMYDKDYYRFSKKGMLPIRWMAPESIIDGIFTPYSDVWSYGVVLYEIITFATNPYPGFSHEQVVQHLKNRKTLTIPKGCKPTLEMLLQKCWEIDPGDRPPAAAIVELLALDPELITPSLDVPAASIALQEATEKIDVQLYDRARVHSFSSVWQSRMNAARLDPNHLGYFQTAQIFQAGLETIQRAKHSGVKPPHKQSIHESFRKANVNVPKNRTPEDLSQVTYL